MDLQPSSSYPRSPTPENAVRSLPTRSSGANALDRVQILETWTNADVSAGKFVVSRSRSEALSRGVNIILASIGMVLAAPLFLIVAVAVKLSSAGPIFYRQTRVGIDRRRRGYGGDMLYDRRAKDLGGSVFTIYKFRSMRADAEKRSGAVWATKGDPRVTTVGRIIRKTRLDELPQLINVIK